MQVTVLGDSPCCVCNSVARLICPPPATNAGPRQECTMSWSRLGHTCGMHTCILTYINTIQARQQTIKQTDKQTRKHTDMQTYIYIHVYINAYMRTSIHTHTLSGRRHVHHGHTSVSAGLTWTLGVWWIIHVGFIDPQEVMNLRDSRDPTYICKDIYVHTSYLLIFSRPTMNSL